MQIRCKMSPRQLVGYCVIFVSCVLVALLIFPSSSEDLSHPNTQVKHKSRFEIKKGLEHGVAYVLFYRRGDHISKSLMKSWAKMAHDVHLSEKKLQITKLDCKKRKYERYCLHELHISTFPTLAWMKDGKIEKTYASQKFNVESLKHFVFENLHGPNKAAAVSTTHKALVDPLHHPKIIHHDMHKAAKSNHYDHHKDAHKAHHKHSAKSSSSSSSSYESNSQTHGKHHLIHHGPAHPAKKADDHKLSPAEHGVLSKFLKKALNNHSNEHHANDIHNHMQNDQHHIEQIAKVHENSLVAHKRVVRKHPVHEKVSTKHVEGHRQAAAPKQAPHGNKNLKSTPVANNANEKRLKKQHEEARIFKNHPKKPHRIPHPLRPHRKSKKKPTKKSQSSFKIMKLTPHNFKSSLSATGITFVIFYGAKTKNPANNKRVEFIKHVAQRYVKNQHSMGEVNCKLEENAKLCKDEKFVTDPMVNIYKKGVLIRHNYQFVHKTTTADKHLQKDHAAAKLPQAAGAKH